MNPADLLPQLDDAADVLSAIAEKDGPNRKKAVNALCGILDIRIKVRRMAEPSVDRRETGGRTNGR